MNADLSLIQDIPIAGLHADNKVALVDIGSNSIRLVIYRAGGRLPHPQFNERDVCRLGEGLSETQMLAQDRMDHALTTLSRFAEIAKASAVETVKLFATEAVRKAKNADGFVAQIEDMFGAKIKILSGDEEAQFAGKGVLSGFVDVDGIVGDLGGGSLELIHVKNMTSVKNQHKASLACGHLLPLNETEIREIIAATPWIETHRGKPFYAVGGTWRAIATAYTAASKKRIDVVHGLTLTQDDLKSMMQEIRDKGGEVEGIPPARRQSMVQALTVMSAILDYFDPSAVIFSSYGAREGILYDELSHDMRRIDPLAAGVAEFALMTQRYDGLGQSLSAQVMPFLHDLSDGQKRLADACCYLADLSWLDHPDYRASLAVEKMLGLSVVGIDHTDRAWMAAVLSVRYAGTFPRRKLFKDGLSKKQRDASCYVGLVMRMLMSFSGGMPGLLDQISINHSKDKITITMPAKLYGPKKGLMKRRIKAIKSASDIKVSVDLT